jgi:hypothetical protein
MILMLWAQLFSSQRNKTLSLSLSLILSLPPSLTHSHTTQIKYREEGYCSFEPTSAYFIYISSKLWITSVYFFSESSELIKTKKKKRNLQLNVEDIVLVCHVSWTNIAMWAKCARMRALVVQLHVSCTNENKVWH